MAQPETLMFCCQSNGWRESMRGCKELMCFETKDIKGQINLFDEAEQEADTDPEIPVITVPEHTRKKKSTHEELFKGVPSRDEVIPLPEEQRKCTECGAALEPIGKEFVRHEFRFTPAKGEVINIYRETYKCPQCSTADAMAENIKFVKAHVPDALIPNSYASGCCGQAFL